MLILNEMSEALASSKEPLIKQIYEKAGKKLLAIGLRRGVELPEHIAQEKAKLMVVQGEIDFNTATHSYRLERFDSFDIPKDIKHSVVGVFDAVFLLLLGDSKELTVF
ncbi:hypothetical protein LY01_00337 [Nonlabens xylanidelens]|uniref:Uncharacterized protein n=1 Tax=Nonlabens xylanidelens TaxID=191564 RepID=A0A2S6IQX7_9FLAO|nr:hypothetical protein [Nonlabens xylanidelens]PPK96516.1 hypothetical protein LY01_00337 [Nonlabens xylanidelens]PQJ13240.1 hypothetical protein BST94_12770 [Nonlabens xylanidelens]